MKRTKQLWLKQMTGFCVPTTGQAVVVCVVAIALGGGISAAAANRKAAESVREGIRLYQAGDYEAAARAFAEADVALPDNPRIAFDRACALFGSGQADKATALLGDAAMAREPEVVAESRYNMGCIQAAKAREVFGEDPTAAPPDTRQEGLQLLASAVGHWRDCLDIAPEHAAARHNLEVVRLWIKHMQDVWDRRDRQQQRDEMDVLQFLMMIEGEQTQLRQDTKQRETEPDSPRRRQATRQIAQAQGQLADEIQPLKDKFETLFEQPAAAAGGAPLDDDERDRALGMLNELANRARSAMLQAAGSLGDQDIASAVGQQGDALGALNEIYMALAPFSNTVQRSLSVQEPLVTASEDLVSRVEAAGEDSDGQGMPEDGTQADYDELARLQGLIQLWAQVLPIKAEQQLQQHASADAASSQNAGQTQGGEEPPVKQIEALGQAAEKAIELAPQIEAAAEQAADALTEQDVAAALPDEQEALRLLKEIADLLPKQDQPPNQQGDQREQPQQSEQQKEKNRDQSEQGDEQQPRPRQGVDRSQAEALLRKVRERERERREREKQLQRYLRSGIQVDKDW